MSQPEQERIVILDFGSQYTQLIARRVRELGVYSQIVPFDAPPEKFRGAGLKGLILSGGPASVYEAGAPRAERSLLELGVPVLGICYGMQLIGLLEGGLVARGSRREYGPADLHLTSPSDPLFAGLPEADRQAAARPSGEPHAAGLRVWMSHGDRIERLPPDYEVLGVTAGSPAAVVRHRRRPIYGLQFHPEVVHTRHGRELLAGFLTGVCGCSRSWTPESFVERAIAEIRARVGRDRVLCALSGGVDSTVVAMLLHRAIGGQSQAVFVDNGLLRQGEADEVERRLAPLLAGSLHRVDAAELFLARLAGVDDPEEKRRVIGHTFIEVFERESGRLGSFRFLAQGTLYPDVIESVSVRGPSATIKTHHNVGGLPAAMALELVEPLRELFKDEVREVGRRLGLPEDAVGRQPFPGPGLAVRILGPVTAARVGLLQAADAIVRQEVEAAGLEREIWQYFAVLLPVRSVGVMGDQRTYEHVAAVRAVTSQDGMTADWFDFPRPVLERIAARVINEVRGINRVVYDVSSKPPATIEWE